MNVLAVDDQPEVVRGLLSGVNWRRAGAEKVFPAYSVKGGPGDLPAGRGGHSAVRYRNAAQ